LVALLLGACGNVDPGTPPADINACRPDRQFFTERVWPEFLAKDYGGKKCGDARCHDALSGRQLVVVPPTSAPAIPLPMDWDRLYRSVAEQLQCTNVDGSPLLTRPDGRQTHGGGKLIEPGGPEESVVRAWVGQK
jgi:hypothetical protein